MRKDILNFKKITDKRGFMLVDGMVAVLIVAIGLVALALTFTKATGVSIMMIFMF